MRPSKKEWILLILVSTLVLAWTSIPNWRGRALQDGRLSYVGTYFDSGDYAVHVAMLRAGLEGDWAYRFRFTTEPHSPQYIRLFYIALGQLDRILRIEPEVLFHIARWILGYAALFALYRLIRKIFNAQRTRWIAFFLVVLGSGLGILQRIFGWVPGPLTPVDFWLIDAYMFFSLALFPHFAFTLALMCTALAEYLDYLSTRGLQHLGIVIAAALLVQCVNPIAFVVVDVMLAGMAVVSWWKSGRVVWEDVLALTIIALAQVPLLLYNFLLLNNDPVWSQFTAQNETLSPAPVYYLWGFGLFWLLGAVGLIRALREREPLFISAAAWIITAFTLAYLPWPIQRRFLLGITIPFGLLAAYALEWMSARFSLRVDQMKQQGSAGFILLIAFMSMTSLVLSPAYALFLQSRPEPYFYPRSLDGAFEWISASTGPQDFFLGAEDTGRLIAQKTGRPVYLGHTMETLHYPEKVEQVEAYYQGDLPGGWISRLPVRWVVYGPFEQRLAPGFVPSPDLVPVFDNASVIIYRVK